uniref:Uncharacterized protein n=1 Tax=viral metagenome TaxID=1070528 RepID=A0A6M3J7U6_9ZZZZ
MKTRQIKFMVIAVKWFDKVNGNTYHSVRCYRNRDGAIVVGPFQYGYGEHYQQTALTVMAEAKWLPAKYRDVNAQFHYERENNYPILWTISKGSKRDCIENGKLE